MPRRVPGTLIRNGIYQAHLRVPPVLREKHGNFIRESLRTSDPAEAEERIAVIKASLRRADNEERIGTLVAKLQPDQKALFEAAGSVEALKDNHERSLIARNFMRAGAPEWGEDDPRHPLEARMEEAEHAAALKTMTAHADAEAKTLRVLGEGAEVIGEVFGLRELSEKYITAKGTPGQTADAVRYAVRRFTELHGELGLSELQIAHIRDYADGVLTLPVSTKPEIRKLSFREAASAAETRKLDTVGGDTQQRHVSHLKALTAFAVHQGWMTTNPWRDYSVPKKRAKHAPKLRVKRPSFTADELREILAYVTANYSIDELDYWAPIIATYHGLRREEIAQIRRKDVLDEGGIFCLSITDEGDAQKGKNAAAVRQIPVHPRVLSYGLKEWAEARPDGFLFREMPRWGEVPADLKPDARGRLSEPYGKRFHRIIKEKLKMREGLVFHGFRHAWQTAADSTSIPEHHRRRLAGRAADDPIEAWYGKGPQMAALLESLKKVDPLV